MCGGQRQCMVVGFSGILPPSTFRHCSINHHNHRTCAFYMNQEVQHIPPRVDNWMNDISQIPTIEEKITLQHSLNSEEYIESFLE